MVLTDCIEVQGDGPELAEPPRVKKFLKLRNASRKSARVSKLTSYGEANLKLFLVLGANEEKLPLLLKRQPESGEPQTPHFLMEYVRLFREYGMDSQVLMRVIKNINKFRRRNMILHIPPHKPKQILKFLRDKIGVKNLEKLVTSTSILLFSLEVLMEGVKTLESLGVVVDGNYVERSYRFLSYGPTTIK